MYREHTIGVIVPAYDEAGRVGSVLRSIPSFVDRIYAVDDRSTDDTWAEIRGVATEEGGQRASDRAEDDWTRGLADEGRWGGLLRARTTDVRPDGRFVAIRHAENRGAGGAIKTGYIAALADGVDVVVTIDGDGQMDPGRMPRVLDPVVAGDADYAKGNRFAKAGSLSEMPTIRLVGNVVLTGLTRLASGYWSISDPQNGYTAISADALADIGVESLFEYYGYCNEVLVRLSVADATVRDVALPARYGDEPSHIDFGTFVPKVSGMLLRNFLWRLAVTHTGPDAVPTQRRAGRRGREHPIETDGSGVPRPVGSSTIPRPSEEKE